MKEVLEGALKTNLSRYHQLKSAEKISLLSNFISSKLLYKYFEPCLHHNLIRMNK